MNNFKLSPHAIFSLVARAAPGYRGQVYTDLPGNQARDALAASQWRGDAVLALGTRCIRAPATRSKPRRSRGLRGGLSIDSPKIIDIAEGATWCVANTPGTRHLAACGPDGVWHF